jgi:hypothetical protein
VRAVRATILRSYILYVEKSVPSRIKYLGKSNEMLVDDSSTFSDETRAWQHVRNDGLRQTCSSVGVTPGSAEPPTFLSEGRVAER